MQRVYHAETMLLLKPKPEVCRNVRFSDEVHCLIGPQRKLRIIREPGERYCCNCIQEQLNRDNEREWKTTWSTVGYDFKSNITFYKTPGNKSGKLSLKIYCNQILEPVVKPWLKLS
jgi:hypothetical protein